MCFAFICKITFINLKYLNKLTKGLKVCKVYTYQNNEFHPDWGPELPCVPTWCAKQDFSHLDILKNLQSFWVEIRLQNRHFEIEMNRLDFNTKFLNYLNLKSTFTVNFSVKTIRLKKFSQTRLSLASTLCA